MKGKLCISRDKMKIFIVMETNKHYAGGFDMRSESYTQVLLKELDEVDIKTVFTFTGKNYTLIGLLGQWFRDNTKFTCDEIAAFASISTRSLHRYISLNEYREEKMVDAPVAS